MPKSRQMAFAGFYILKFSPGEHALDPQVFSRPRADPAKNLTVSSSTEGEWEQGGSGGMLPWGKFWDHLLRISCLNLDICWTIFPNFLYWTE